MQTCGRCGLVHVDSERRCECGANLGPDTGVPAYASPWNRHVAVVVDNTILGIPLVIADAVGVNIYSGRFLILLGLIYVVYHAVMESSTRQATWGKVVAGIRVTDLNGGRITLLRAFARNIARPLSWLSVVGYAMVFVMPKKQALHDWLTSCLVQETLYRAWLRRRIERNRKNRSGSLRPGPSHHLT